MRKVRWLIAWCHSGKLATRPPNFASMAGWLKDIDPGRFVHYEGAQGDPTHPNYVGLSERYPTDEEKAHYYTPLANPTDPKFVDVISRMYPTLEELQGLADSPFIDRPILMCEYAHAMGNSVGNLAEYWEMVRARPNLIGGFIWDWIDQGLETTNEKGETYLAYGGDFGDTPNASNFCINGVMDSYRQPNPHAWEAKYVFQPAAFSLSDAAKGEIVILNRFFFDNLKHYALTWTLSEDGAPIQQGELDIGDLPAGQEKALLTGYRKPTLKAGARYWLNLSLSLKEDTKWAAKGHELAKAQFALPYFKPAEAVTLPKAALTVSDTADNLTIKGDEFSVVFNRETGYLSQFNVKGKPIITAPLKHNFWRPQTDNDRIGWQTMEKKKVWFDASQSLPLSSFDVQSSSNGTLVRTRHQQGDDILVDTQYFIDGNGTISVTMNLDADTSLPDMLRVGMTTDVNGSLERMAYYGKGPHENYIDRNQGAKTDVYQGLVSDFVHNYVRPQENGNRTGVRWLTLSNYDNFTFTVRGKDLLSMSVWPWSAENLQNATHPYELVTRDVFTVNIDLIQAGVGGIDSWSPNAAPIKKYRIPAGQYQYEFSLEAGVNK